ncbi:hypothetical protein Neosp_004863 [[Neocosmospora] mangrovei]
MSRHEGFSKHESSSLMPPGGTKKRKLYLESPQKDQRGCDPSQRTGGDGCDAESEARTRHRPITTIDWRAELCRVLGEPLSVSDENILDKLNAELDELKEARRLQHVLDDGHYALPRHQVIYRIQCESSGSEEAYANPPWMVESGPYNAHLRGSSPISNIELYLARNPDIAFLVYADFECCNVDPTEFPIRHLDQCHSVDEDVLPLLTQESVAIVSKKMLDALEVLAGRALQGIPHPEFDVSSSNGFLFPYLWWFHRREEIDRTISGLDDESRRYLSVLQDYIHSRLQKEWEKVDELISKRSITTEYLDYIYVPGEIAISKLDGSDVAQVKGYQTTSWLRRPSRLGSYNGSITATSWSFDGSFKQIRKYLVIPSPRFTGEFAITSLAFYPQKFASDETVAALLKRGNMFWKCRKRNYVFHAEVRGDGTQNSLDSRFMVDMETYNHMHPQGRDGLATLAGEVILTLPPEAMDQDKPELGNDFFMCLPSRTVGFNMQKKEWVNLDVHFLEDVQWNTQAFDYLVVNPVAKELIKAVVMSQLSGQANADLIQGKGNGLFMLLHGNRVGIFDEGFKSRIQLSLRYNDLGQQERHQIWKNFLSHLDQFQKSALERPNSQSQRESLIGHGIDISNLQGHLEDLSQADLNGREIRNALSTARQLALYRKQPLQYCHLRDVMDEAKKFDEYLKELRQGLSADDIAKDKAER